MSYAKLIGQEIQDSQLAELLKKQQEFTIGSTTIRQTPIYEIHIQW